MWRVFSSAQQITGADAVDMRGYQADLPPGAAGNWVFLRMRGPRPENWWVKIEIEDSSRGHIVREAFLRKPSRFSRHATRSTLIHVPQDAAGLRIFIFGTGASDFAWSAHTIPRRFALLILLALGLPKLPHALKGNHFGRLGRVRTVLGQAPMRAGEAPPYSFWIDMVARRTQAIAATAASFDATIVLCPGPPSLLAATRTALSTQSQKVTGGIAISEGALDFWAGLRTKYVVILAAGEIPAPEALARFARHAAQNPECDAIFADYDSLDANKIRCDPILRPAPAPLGIESGIFARGMAVFDRNVTQSLGASLDADLLRYAAALRAQHPSHITQILSHRDRACGDGDFNALAAHLGEHKPGSKPWANHQVIFAWRQSPQLQDVLLSIIIPSRAEGDHVLFCIRALLANLGPVRAEILLAVTKICPGNLRQALILQEIAHLDHVKILDMGLASFNYAIVNNRAAAKANGRFLLFLNDDVAPRESRWLSHMLGHLNEPNVIAVGARLVYGNGDVQHGGVTLGLGGLAEHTGRLFAAESPGPGGIFWAEREVSALTGACLLMRRDDFTAIGGFDEAYAIALNDVDLCLRLGACGRNLIYASLATLWHFEQVSLGRHYQGERKIHESLEVSRLRSSYATALANDMFYNPHASLEPGREWQLRFSPQMQA